MAKNIITINGKHYDANSGALLSESPSASQHKPTAQSHEASAQAQFAAHQVTVVQPSEVLQQQVMVVIGPFAQLPGFTDSRFRK